VAHYGTEAKFEEYCLQMGYTPTEGEVDPALERATLWLDTYYGPRYPGKRTEGRSQPLGWPRTGVVDCQGQVVAPDEVPIEIERATYEAALRELSAPYSLSPDVTAGKVYKSVSVSGAVSVTYAHEGGVVASQRPTLTIVDDMLSCLLSAGQAGRSMVKWLQRT